MTNTVNHSWKIHIIPLTFFSLLTLVYTYPLFLNISTLSPGPPEDFMQTIWNFWWVKKSVLQHHTSPLFSDYIFYPTGTSLVFHDFSFYNTLLAGLPLSLFFNEIASCNILLILSFILSAMSMYILAYHLTKDCWASVVAGAIFSFCPYHVWHFEHHLGLSNIQFLPLAVLFLIKQYEAPSLRNILSGVFFLTLVALCSWYYLIFLTIFAFCFCCYLYLFGQKKHIIKASPGIIMGYILTGILLLPLIYPMLTTTIGPQVGGSAVDYSSDLLGFFVPSLKHPLARKIGVKAIYNNFTCPEWESTVYIGYIVMFLAIFACVKVKHFFVCFFGFMAIFCMVLSLGPTLHINGTVFLSSIKLPYYWLIEKVSFLNIMRVPARFTIVSVLCLSVLSGYAVKEMRTYFSSQKKILLSCIILFFIVFEQFAYPIQTANLNIVSLSEPIADILTKDDDDFAILEIPLSNYYIFNAISMMRQVKHGKRILLPYISREPAGVLDFIMKGPLNILFLNSRKTDTAYFRNITPFLKKNKIKYIVFSKYLYGTLAIEDSLWKTFPGVDIGNKASIYRVY